MASEQRRRAIVLVLDRLGSGYLGPYGNTWLETPVLNDLASHALLLEQTVVTSTDLADLYRQLWAGIFPSALHPVPAAGDDAETTPEASAESSACLQDLLGCQGRVTRLVTDEPTAGEWPAVDRFHFAQHLLHERLVSADPADAETLEDADQAASAHDACAEEYLELAEEPEWTGMAQLMAAATEAFEQPDWDLLWIHARAMNGPWDAPDGFRLQFGDEEDPDPPMGADPPAGPLPADMDPDWLQGWIWAYGGQVELADWCLRPLYERWREAPEPILWIVLGARGYALGEHGHVGGSATRLHSELLQVPFLVASNQWCDTQARCQTLVQPAHLRATLLDWFQISPPPGDWADSLLPWWQGDADELAAADASAFPPLVVARQGSEWALRTPAWHACLRPLQPAEDTGELPQVATDWACELYFKPDDRWDCNDVAARCESVVAAFLELRKRLEDAAHGVDPGGRELDPLLLHGLE